MSDIASICVYCGSSVGVGPAHREAAAILGRELAVRGIRLVFGGGNDGLMGIVADAALEADGQVLGVIPDHLHEQGFAHSGVTDLVVVDSMHERKHRMFELSDAFVALSGGIGTVEELFEILKWKQHRLHHKPIVVVDIDHYWMPLHALLKAMVQAGFHTPDVLKLFTVVERVDDVFAAVAGARERLP